MTASQMVREVLEEAMARREDFARLFYDRLFAAHPEVKPLFHRSSSDAQEKMFLQKLMLLVDSLDSDERLRGELAAVGRTHQGYGVTPQMYRWLGEVLVATVREAKGGALAPEQAEALASAWRKMSDLVFEVTGPP